MHQQAPSSLPPHVPHVDFRLTVGTALSQLTSITTLSAHGMQDLPRLTTQTAIGITVAISGNILISLALNLQKLAHKRLDKLKHGPNNGSVGTKPHRPVLNSPPRLNEQDEDAEIIANHQDYPQTPSSETQPLLPVHNHNNHNRYHTTFEREDQPPEDEPQKKSILLRIFRSKKEHGKKRRVTLLPIDVMAEDAALHGLETPRKHRENGGNDEDETAYLKSKLWWSGFVLMNVGELGNFISYAFAPASVVAPLGTFALIANCVFAPFLLGEHFRKRDFVGICVAVVGAVTVVLSSNASDARLNPEQLVEAIKQTPFLIYACIYIVGAIILATLSHGGLGRRYVFIDVGLCALFGGFTVLSTKALSTIITMRWYGVFADWITYPLILTLVGTGVGQIRYLNRALMRFEGKAVIPIQFVFFTLSAITGSAVLYGDFKKAGFHEITTFLYGCAATFAGVFILANGNSHEETTPRPPQPDETPEEGTRLGMGTIGKRQRATLVLPSGMESPRDTPSVRKKRSSVGLVGISPGQHLLLVHNPAHEGRAESREREAGQEGGESASPSSYGRNRVLHGPGYDGVWSGSPRSRTNTLRDSAAPERLRSPQIFGSPTRRSPGR